MRALMKLAMRVLKTLARAILSFTLLPIRVAVVESKWIAGSNLGRNPGDDIDSDIETFVGRDSVSPQMKDIRNRFS